MIVGMEDQAMTLPNLGLEMATVMLEIKRLNVSLMVEIVVHIPKIMEMAIVTMTITYRVPHSKALIVILLR